MAGQRAYEDAREEDICNSRGWQQFDRLFRMQPVPGNTQGTYRKPGAELAFQAFFRATSAFLASLECPSSPGVFVSIFELQQQAANPRVSMERIRLYGYTIHLPKPRSRFATVDSKGRREVWGCI